MGSEQVDKQDGIGVLFVCLGNICRSPLAEALLRRQVDVLGLSQQIRVDSCGTAAFNVGKAPDPRAIKAAARRDLDIAGLRARQINADDYLRMDYIIAMDRINLINTQTWAPQSYGGEIKLLMHYSRSTGNSQVADPFYENEDKFEELVDTLDSGVAALLNHIIDSHQIESMKRGAQL